MNQGPDLARAISLAADVHSTQVDKADEPYILHPLRVMKDAMEQEDGSVVVGIVAVLHDVLEDNEKYATETLRRMIRIDFGDDCLEMIDLLSKRPGEDYMQYIQRIKDSASWAITIKLADLRDNMTILRQPTLEDKDLLRIQKYHYAYRVLSDRY